MQGRGAGRRDGGFGDEAVWLQNNRSNPQIPLVLKTASSDGKQSGSFRFGGLKVVTGAPPANGPCTHAAWKCSVKTKPETFPSKKGPSETLRIFQRVSAGLVVAGKLLLHPGWATALVKTNNIHFGTNYFSRPRCLPWAELQAVAAAPLLLLAALVSSLGCSQMPPPHSSSPARPLALCRAALSATEPGVKMARDLLQPCPGAAGARRRCKRGTVPVKAAALQPYLHPPLSILPGSTWHSLALGAFLAPGRQGSRRASRS